MTFKSNVIKPLSIIPNALCGVAREGEVGSEDKNAVRDIKPKTVPLLPFNTSNSYTLPRSASSATKLGVEPPQQSHATQFTSTKSSKIVIGLGAPASREGAGALPLTNKPPSSTGVS